MKRQDQPEVRSGPIAPTAAPAAEERLRLILQNITDYAIFTIDRHASIGASMRPEVFAPAAIHDLVEVSRIRGWEALDRELERSSASSAAAVPLREAYQALAAEPRPRTPCSTSALSREV